MSSKEDKSYNLTLGENTWRPTNIVFGGTSKSITFKFDDPCDIIVEGLNLTEAAEYFLNECRKMMGVKEIRQPKTRPSEQHVDKCMCSVCLLKEIDG